jgi:ABC transporter, phosphonate, periplasmic substrate-binding protein/PhoD-like phosphatase
VQWLKRALLNSRATWKVIASDMPLGLQVPDILGFEAWANGDGSALGRELELADLLQFIKYNAIKNVVWLTADVHYAAAHLYDPAQAQFTDFNPFWEFVAGPLHAGTFGPNKLDNTFSGSHEASILAVMHKKVEVASTNLPDIQQLTREGKVPRGALRVIWVSKLIPNDPIVVRKDLPDSLRQAIQDSLVAMQEKHPEVFAAAGSIVGGFQKVDDAKYQVIRELNETSKRLVAQQ